MFEDKKAKEIHNEMLNDISNEYDKTDGSFIYDTTKPSANQFEKAYQSMNEVVEKFDVDNLTGEELERFIYQRTGQERRKATFSVGELEVKGNGTINQGDLFETKSGVQFISTETKLINQVGNVKIRAVIPGNIGNTPAQQIIEIPISLAGINSITNIYPTTDGYDEESDDDLRERYKERIRTPATSGNIYHYKSWAKEVPGVGEVKVIPLWNGDNTVKIVIIDSNMQPASPLLVQEVQKHIDPNGTGLGDGQAPIGAYCTVISAIPIPINLVFNATLKAGYSVEVAEENVSKMIVDYLKKIAFKQDFVSYAQSGSLILDSEGVEDYSNLKINDEVINVSIGNEEIAVLGGVEIVQ
ncbi:baseplate J/gp47 family protein [Heyndrickxia sp. FSL W8-0496]|uniref:baseplate J/gp47 family protein n=1 Tax=Heyndrickxia sp. FSL W8-0496 TaxID=2954702 RepID=UPI0030FBA2C4